jgi:hypothetical protein
VRHTDFRLTQSAHCKTAQYLRSFFPEDVSTLDQGLELAYERMTGMVQILAVEFPLFKVNFVLHVEMLRYSEEGAVEEQCIFPFRGRGLPLSFTRRMAPATLQDELMNIVGDFERNVDEFLFQVSVLRSCSLDERNS